MTCDGTGRLPCGGCGGEGSRSSPHCPSLNLYAVYLCPTCMGKRTVGKCPGCPACQGWAKTTGETQRGLFG